MATMNISLPDQMKNWVEECVQNGRYSNSSDYVRDLIRRDHMKVEQLRQALIEGENSGPATGLNIDAFIADKKKSLSL
jgi:antitoxin ParD1/3/4